MPDEFEKLIATQLQRSLRGFGHQVDGDQSDSVARAIAIRLKQEGWTMTPPVLDLVDKV